MVEPSLLKARLRSLIDTLPNETILTDRENNTFLTKELPTFFGDVHDERKTTADTLVGILSVSSDVVELLAKLLKTPFLTVEVHIYLSTIYSFINILGLYLYIMLYFPFALGPRSSFHHI